jgi:hypothetical protein
MGPERIRAHLSLVLSQGAFGLESRLQLWLWPCLWTALDRVTFVPMHELDLSANATTDNDCYI